jgi:hypothetical protein
MIHFHQLITLSARLVIILVIIVMMQVPPPAPLATQIRNIIELLQFLLDNVYAILDIMTILEMLFVQIQFSEDLDLQFLQIFLV